MNITQMRIALKELWQIRNPHINFDKNSYNLLKQSIAQEQKKETKKIKIPFTKKVFFELTTARNQNLINQEEQHVLRKTVVGFFGLSVGSHAALTWMMQSRADVVKIADFDYISVTNLNRLRVGYASIGKAKVTSVKNQLLDINPFCQVYEYRTLSEKNIEEIINKPRVDVVVDEVDSIQEKLLLRKIAKKNKIPLVSAADVGDNVIVDIERYDNEENIQPFLGKLPGIENVDFSRLTGKQKKKMIIQLLGFENWSERLLDSIFAIGGSVPTWPQLGATATISGGVVTTLIKKIILGEKIKSGRYSISLDDVFVADFNIDKNKGVRNKKIKYMKELLGI